MEDILINNLKDLCSGENPHQKAWISPVENNLDYEILSHNKELEYLDYINLSQAIKILGEFFDVNCCTIVKESSVSAVALGATSEDAYEKLIDCDPISVTNGTVGFSKNVTLHTAKQLHAMKIRNIISTSFDKEAFKYLLDTNINIVKVNTPLHELQGFTSKDIKVTPFGILIQEQNTSKLSKDTFTVVSEAKPTQEQVEDGIFAWKISKHLKNKSIIVAKDLSTKSIVQGVPNEVQASELAMDFACEHTKDAVMVVDSYIENTALINTAIQGRIGLIIEAGDGKNSKEILKYADKYGISVIYTKIRNNKYCQ